MTTPDPDASLRAFFERLDPGPDADLLAGADLFYTSFLALDPHTVSVVTREQLRAVLPMRVQLFGSVGATGCRLRDLHAHPVGEQHVLADTSWDVVFEDVSAEPLVLHASYLLRRDADDWSVVVYLNHQDLGDLLAARREAAAS